MNQKQHLNCFLFFIVLIIGVASSIFIIDRISEKRTNGIEQSFPSVQTKTEYKEVAQKPLTTLSFAEAKIIALKHANIKESDIHFTEVSFDQEDNEYEIHFVSDTMRYEYSIHSKNGTIASWDNDILLPDVSNVESSYLTYEKASSLAQNRVANATLLYCRFDYDDNIPVYEGKLREGISTYEFTINAQTGSFISWEKD